MNESTQIDLDLARATMTVSGTRVRVRQELTVPQAERLIQRGLAELQDDVDTFNPNDPQKSLRVTQYGFDLMLGRVTP